MNIFQLETFLKIAETKNFTTAGNILGYAQSTVTAQIKGLEDELGCLLFERLGKSIVLTAEGEKLCVYAEKMLQLKREIFLEVPPSKEPAGIIKLGISESLCYDKFPKVLLKYRKKYPKVDIQIQFINHDTFPLMLKNGALDLVYTLNPIIEEEGLLLLEKHREELAFFASPSHPLAKKTAITENDLQDLPLLLTGHNCNFRHMLLEDLKKHSIAPRVALETSSKEILKQFAINQLGVAFMPEMAGRAEVKAKKLKRLDWKGEDFPIFSQLLVYKDKRISSPIEALEKMLIQEDAE
ncbi:MAG: LysR family transcriptional regulator [Treponema sp.]|nr:LysR family transcriptional regulator [Treponema sp.]MBR4387321.1 LysR family transcriptional regulator [Treponema sp.]